MVWTMLLNDDSGAGACKWLVWKYLLLSMFLVATLTKADLEDPKDKYYTWKTGQWGRCMGEDCGPGGVQTRTVWCVHSEGWTTHHSNCRHTEKPESQRECFKVCEWHQELFEWEVTEWGPCVLVPYFSNELKVRTSECVTAQHGIQQRKAHCIRKSNRTVVTERICEFFSQRPAVEQACLIPCPHDCVVSEFSPWSDCSKTCGTGLQHRTRAVLATPVYGGANCPNLTETRTCSNQLSCSVGEDEFRYSLKVGPWSECRLPRQKEARLSGRTMLDFSTESAEKSSVKLQVQSTRHHHHHHSKSWDIEIGYQTRQVRCTRSDGKNAMLSLCIQDSSPVTFQSCVMPRPCETSDWSSWSPCSKMCRSVDLSPGYRTRTRSLKRIPVGGGRECPVLEEREACNIIADFLPKCPRYMWKVTEWGECQVTPLLSQQDQRLSNLTALCGGGIQMRETYCVQIPDDTASHKVKEVSRPVNGNLCPGPVPPAVQQCSVPCAEECLVSAWSPWGLCMYENCLEPIGRRGFRQRWRRVLRDPSGTFGSCPHLVESVPCEDPACFWWHEVEKGLCVPSEGTCGPGIRAQKLLCQDSQGEAVPSEQCLDVPPPSQLPCEVPCPSDCVLSSWSAWSACSHSCSSKSTEGRQSRTRTVLALPGPEGEPCPAAVALEEWRLCNDHPCSAFYWEVSSWGDCIEDSSVTNLNATNNWNGRPACAIGVQTRKVTCMKVNIGQVTPKRCPDSTRPDAIRPCLLPCRKDCTVTPFSEWTPCPTACQPANATAPKQSRYRIVIQKSANGGQECPDTLHEERECEPLPLCPTYRWIIHKWQQCTIVPDSVRQGITGVGESCGRGLEARGVTCVRDDGEDGDVTECLQWAGTMPLQVRECRVPCRDDCTFTSWSKFTLCTGCGAMRSRKRALAGRSKKKEKCQKTEPYPLVEVEPCPCDKFQSRPFGNWSDCILADSKTESFLGWSIHREIKECGQGVRYRAIVCTDQEDRLVDPFLCSPSGYIEESCHIPCPFDCKLSDWSSWSVCSSQCGSGIKMRSRWLREKPFSGGRPCPKLDLKNQAQVYEAVPCYNHCSQYVWKTEAWSVCTINTVDKAPDCGEGVQSRKIRCVKTVGEGPGVAVDDALCDQEEMPVRAQTCFLPCPEDCVMSAWGQWSTCPSPCDQKMIRQKTRRVLRPPQAGRSCPEDTETEPCLLNTNCFTYQYNVSEWSTCQLSENAVCGEGVRFRLLDCVRSDRKVVELRNCEQLGLVNKWRLTTHCLVDCPLNCLLSDWSSWAECSHTCGDQGLMARTRSVIQQAHDEGRPCPAQLTQVKPCPIRPCFSWLKGEWSQCRVEGADCGEGVRERNLTCVVHRGSLSDLSSAEHVEEEKCEGRPVTVSGQGLQVPCSVPCPGDCHLTEWSLWSSCQLTCLDGRSFETTGRQARSRAVIIQAVENQDSCPHQVFETRPCKGGKCHSYEWRTSPWRDNVRSVWCQRSDGVNVTGGCFLQTRPATIRHCHPPCTKPFSHCTQSGVCGCEKGYTEVMTAYGFLDYCTKTPGADNKKADVKTSAGKFKPGTSNIQDFFKEWSIQPFGPDGRIKIWVYGVTAVGFVLIMFIIAMSFLVCKKPKQNTSATPQQKPLTLAYDGDLDM
nr:PREDICTED: thrombospondin type-1 domain-containing protein 7B isoform X1 [Lepisosteus oculatus]XP_015213732.1 PREDICTED: thrombospondin type-1 domain-containing protein 7B isoform X1 [Lepisosteus oculatus]